MIRVNNKTYTISENVKFRIIDKTRAEIWKSEDSKLIGVLIYNSKIFNKAQKPNRIFKEKMDCQLMEELVSNGIMSEMRSEKIFNK